MPDFLPVMTLPAISRRFVPSPSVDRRQPLIEERSAIGNKAFEVGLDRERQRAAPFQLF